MEVIYSNNNLRVRPRSRQFSQQYHAVTVASDRSPVPRKHRRRQNRDSDVRFSFAVEEIKDRVLAFIRHERQLGHVTRRTKTMNISAEIAKSPYAVQSVSSETRKSAVTAHRRKRRSKPAEGRYANLFGAAESGRRRGRTSEMGYCGGKSYEHEQRESAQTWDSMCRRGPYDDIIITAAPAAGAKTRYSQPYISSSGARHTIFLGTAIYAIISNSCEADYQAHKSTREDKTRDSKLLHAAAHKEAAIHAGP